MKKFLPIFISVLFLLSVSSLCFAAPEDSDLVVEDPDPLDVAPVSDLSMDLIVNDSVSGREVINSLITALSDSNKSVPDDYVLKDVQLRSLSPVTPSSTSGLKSALLSVLGNYDAIVVEYSYQSSQGYTSYLREIQPDYVWLCSCAILLVTLFCLFRLGGAALSKR